MIDLEIISNLDRIMAICVTQYSFFFFLSFVDSSFW